MIAYAGIGSRDINRLEEKNINIIAKLMSRAGIILYSGNAAGSDIAFQSGSDGKCIVMLPWDGFNIDKYDYTNSRDCFILGDSKDGISSVEKYHPNPSALKRGGKALMARNYHQIVGYRQYPRVSIVICCANVRNGKVQGGTGQATRIADDFGINIINIRQSGWKEKIGNFVSKYTIHGQVQ